MSPSETQNVRGAALHSRVTAFFRDYLTEYGLDTTGWKAETVPYYENDPSLLLQLVLKRGVYEIRISKIYTDPEGYPLQWDPPVLR